MKFGRFPIIPRGGADTGRLGKDIRNIMDDRQQQMLRSLPAVDQLLLKTEQDAFFEAIPKAVVVSGIRHVLDALRGRIKSGDAVADTELSADAVMAAVRAAVNAAMTPNLRRTVNATGVVVHTNLGRSLLAEDAMDHLVATAGRYSNLEYDLSKGRRGSRYEAVESLIVELTGAEAAMVVNNNAAAVLLCLDTVAKGREVPVSRGELVEIGGSFRIPDVMAKSGAILKEIGTTNRTHLRDYENAVNDRTGMLLKVHTSNYSVVGFTTAVSLADLVALGGRHGLPVMEDLGSGTLIDFSAYGLQKEPTIRESVSTGADLVTFSGDKLLGGPQAGMIVGKSNWIEAIRRNPLTRALRIDKLTLSALESTLRLYRDEPQAVTRIPTLRMLTMGTAEISGRAEQLKARLEAVAASGWNIGCVERSSKAGGGALPLLNLPTVCVRVRIEGMSANAVEVHMRSGNPPVIGRIEDDQFIMDLRTVQDEELEIITEAFARLARQGHP